jgi:hypothetical protein
MLEGTIDPKKIIVVFKGRPITGFADGTYLQIERNADTWNTKVGCSGHVARSKSNDRSGTVKITLMQTSSDNDFLSLCAELDENGNAGVGELKIKDALGTSDYRSSAAFVLKPAAASQSNNVENREWTLFCADLSIFNGGNISIL